MKVLSLTEPYATLTKEKKKRIETRGWKTNYRGILYIHASMTKINALTLENKELMSLVEEKELNFGYIICKCILKDCVYMTEEYINDMKEKNHQEYICGEYSVGRYAWILEEIEPLKYPIEASGQLNIWDYYDEFEILDLMKDVDSSLVLEDYNILQAPKEVKESKIGNCFDLVELERYYFKCNPWNIKTYFMNYCDETKTVNHAFLTFQKNGKFYWFEHYWNDFMGIHEYSDQKSLLLDIKDKFIKYLLTEEYKEENFVLYEYKKPKYHISLEDFYNHCINGKYIDLNR